jgi:DNA-binding response OmpR family regulator
MLPGIDGLAVLAALRQSRQTPVLMLTARAQVEDRVKGLQAGADDYLVKPFAFSELVARIHALLRRGLQARPRPKPRCCAWPIWSWICCVTAPRVRASGWT